MCTVASLVNYDGWGFGLDGCEECGSARQWQSHSQPLPSSCRLNRPQFRRVMGPKQDSCPIQVLVLTRSLVSMDGVNKKNGEVDGGVFWCCTVPRSC